LDRFYYPGISRANAYARPHLHNLAEIYYDNYEARSMSAPETFELPTIDVLDATVKR
jgi:hypothetical protein